MKKSLFFLLFIVLICSCSMITGNSPSNIAVKFAEATNNGDTALAKTYVDTSALTQYAKGYFLAANLDFITGRSTPGVSYKVFSTSNLEGGKVLVVLVSNEPGRGETKTEIFLININGVWKVDLNATVARILAPAIYQMYH